MHLSIGQKKSEYTHKFEKNMVLCQSKSVVKILIPKYMSYQLHESRASVSRDRILRKHIWKNKLHGERYANMSKLNVVCVVQ
jgi:hypothetical protein